MDRATPSAGVVLPSALDQARVTRLPSTAYYIPDFISEEEQQVLLDKVRPLTFRLDVIGWHSHKTRLDLL